MSRRFLSDYSLEIRGDEMGIVEESIKENTRMQKEIMKNSTIYQINMKI